VNKKLRTITVHTTDTIASLVSTCSDKFLHYFASNTLRVLSNGVDLATYDQECTLANVNIYESTKLTIGNGSGNGSISSVLNFSVKTLTGKEIAITNAYSHW
jgi:hypothetical protein